MVPRIVHGYAAWWHIIQIFILGMDKDEKGEEVAKSKGSSKYDPYQVNNPMHDISYRRE